MARLLWVVALVACGSSTAPDQPASPTPTPVAPSPPREVATAPSDAGASAVAPVVPIDAGAAAPIALPGADFLDEARALFRVAGCADGPLPAAFAGDPKYAKVIERHCKAIAPHVAKFREVYLVQGKAWLDKHVPADIPSTVVYPFGGGDLLSAIAVFPAASEVTTISLEQAGDPRAFTALPPQKLDTELARFREEVSWLIQVGSNTSVNLSSQQKGAIPGQVASFLLALAVGGYEPTAMRFFRVEPSGQLHYFERAEIEADKEATKALSSRWHKPSFAASFRNVELRFRKAGGPEQVHRHIAWNLGDKELAKEPGLLRHLEAKGKVTMIVKGASYLLWRDDFATMRKYLLDHLAFMLSDSTGIPPSHAGPAGMVQQAWGKYVKPGLPFAVGMKGDLEMRELWKKSAGPAPFRFGYIDSANNHHLLITRPK